MRLEDHRRLIRRFKENGYHLGNQYFWLAHYMQLWYEWVKVRYA